VAVVGLVLDVGDRDRDPALALLGRVVDRVEGAVLGLALQAEVLRDRRGQTRLAVVDMADRPDVDVRLGALELLLGQSLAPPIATWRPMPALSAPLLRSRTAVRSLSCSPPPWPELAIRRSSGFLC
jgi:hypothetical protein